MTATTDHLAAVRAAQPTFRIATDDDLRSLGYSSHWDAFKVLIGPDGWHCSLGEPEDCTWSRDGRDAVDMLNKQHAEIARLTAELAAARAELVQSARAFGLVDRECSEAVACREDARAALLNVGIALGVDVPPLADREIMHRHARQRNAADVDCAAHRVDWRARAIAAEADAAKWRAAIARTKEPGDPVLCAIAELLSCTYLDAVPTPDDDDHRRELAVAARIANDERRAKLGEGPSTPSARRDAAKWRKVEPLIERLRTAAEIDASDPIHVVDAAIAILAADVTP